ncbi:MAG: hypothetical protein RL026_1238 [Pseudomonadota bacterium]|jgi:hypothetical protein
MITVRNLAPFALALALVAVAGCSSKEDDAAGMTGTIAPAQRVEDTQVETADVPAAEPAPLPAEGEAGATAPGSNDVDAALSGAGAAGSKSSNKTSDRSSNRNSNSIELE